ncbi:MAG: MFS transporter [Armatimonadetes bacterium]|nr:MFS transporter [Armatimonadota bacterium]
MMVQETPEPQPVKESVIRRTLICITVVAAFAELGYAVMNISALTPYLKFDIGLGKYIGVIVAAFLVSEAVFKSPMGLLGDRWGRKRLIVLGPILSAISPLLLAHATHPVMFVLLRTADGIGAAAIWPSAFALIGDTVPAHRRAGAMSLFNVAYLGALALAPLLGGEINVRMGDRRASFYLISLLFALTALISWFLLPADGPKSGTGRARSDGHTVSGRDMWQILKVAPGMLVTVFLIFLGVGLLAPVVKIYAMEHFTVSEAQFGRYFLVPAIGIAAMAIPLGHMGDRWGHRRSILIGMGLCSAGMWGLVTATHIWLLVGYATLLGLGFVMGFPSWMAWVSQLTDESRRGAMIGANGTSQGIGAIVGAVLGPFLYDAWSPRSPFILCAVCLTLSFLLAFVVLKEKKSKA